VTAPRASQGQNSRLGSRNTSTSYFRRSIPHSSGSRPVHTVSAMSVARRSPSHGSTHSRRHAVMLTARNALTARVQAAQLLDVDRSLPNADVSSRPWRRASVVTRKSVAICCGYLGARAALPGERVCPKVQPDPGRGALGPRERSRGEAETGCPQGSSEASTSRLAARLFRPPAALGLDNDATASPFESERTWYAGIASAYVNVFACHHTRGASPIAAETLTGKRGDVCS